MLLNILSQLIYPLADFCFKLQLAEQLFRLIFGLAEWARELGNPVEKYA